MFKEIQFFEEPEAEIARLAQSPEGSLNHALSRLPVNILEDVRGKAIELPRLPQGARTSKMIVVPVRYSPYSETEELPRRRYGGWWDCVVIESDDPTYRHGGYDLSIPEAELVRGRHRTFAEADQNEAA